MLKKRELSEVSKLYELLSHPEVYPFVRQKAESPDQFYFITKQTLEAEERGELISRTILNEYGQPIGIISLFDIQNNCGFLATWIGQPYFGQGYNKLAKEEFFDELFYIHNIDIIFMKIRKTNIRSAKAAAKLPYVIQGNEVYPDVYRSVNSDEEVYDLYAIPAHLYHAHKETAMLKKSEEVI